MQAPRTGWVIALTAIGSLMAALDTLVVSTRAEHDPARSRRVASSSSSGPSTPTTSASPSCSSPARRSATGTAAAGSTPSASASSPPRPRPARSRPDVGWLIAARAVQGAGAALIMPLGLALLSAAFPPEKRGAAIGDLQRDHRRSPSRSGPLVGGAVVAGHQLGVDLLAQRPDRPGRDPARAHPDARELRAATRRSTSPAWRSSPAARSGSCGASCAATRPAGAAPRCSARWSPARCWSPAFVAWELRAREPMLPLRALPLARVLGRQRGDLLHVRLAVRRRVLLRPAAADRARLRPARAPGCGCCRGPRRSSRSRRSPARWPTGSASGR